MEMRDFFLLYQDKHEALGTSHAYTGPPAYATDSKAHSSSKYVFKI